MTLCAVKVYKATGEGVDDLRINVVDQVPDLGERWRDTAAIYEQDAALLFDALAHALPGGTLDRLLVKMLEHKASMFRVPDLSGEL